MSTPSSLASHARSATPDLGTRRVRRRIAELVRRIRESEYVTVGSSARYRAVQRRRVVTASRVGFVVIAAAVIFDAVALYDLQPGIGPVLLALNGSVAVLARIAVNALRGRARRRPEPVTALVTLAVTLATAVTAVLLPQLAIQTIGYLLLIPGLVALIVPWRTFTHIRWLAGYAAITFGYLALGPSAALTSSDRGDLVVVAIVAVVTSLAGHVLLQRAQIRNHTQLQKIEALHRRADADMAELARVHHELEETSRQDPLTGAGNRIRLREDLRTARARMARLNHSHGLVVLDLDHFKRVNDELGHLTGDEVLRKVVSIIKATIRSEDAVYRFGGEEFLTILRLSTLDDLATVAERLRSAVADAAIPHPDNGSSPVVTISLGGVLVTPTDLDRSDDEWFAAADAALYRAKANGRNRAEITG